MIFTIHYIWERDEDSGLKTLTSVRDVNTVFYKAVKRRYLPHKSCFHMSHSITKRDDSRKPAEVKFCKIVITAG